MKKSLSKSAMLQQWRLLRVAEPLRLDCTVSRTDGVDFTEILTAEMRTWYLNLLDSGPEEFLAPVDVTAQALVERQGNLTVIRAPEDVRRILRVRLQSMSAPIEPTADAETVRARGRNHFCRRPLAARIDPRTVIVSGASGALVQLTCAVDHGDQVYVFDDRALTTPL